MKHHQADRMLNRLILTCICLTTAVAGTQSLRNVEQKMDDTIKQIKHVEHITPSRNQQHTDIQRLLVMTTVKNQEDESFQRFNRSIETYNLDLSVLRWPNKPGSEEGKQNYDNLQQISQLSLIKKALKTYKSEPNLLIMIVDSENTILNGNQKDIVNKFTKKFDTKTRVLFAADSICWPNSDLADKFPAVPAATGGERYLHSGAYLGFAAALWDLLNEGPDRAGDLRTTTDSQSYFTRVYLDELMREKIGIRIDHKSELFQNMRNGNTDLRLELELDGAKLKNLAHESEPLIALGNEESRMALNTMGNYLARAWTPNDGCRHCRRDKITLPEDDNELPTVVAGLFIEFPTPFLEEFFEDLFAFNYSKSKIHLIVHNSVTYHDKVVNRFLTEHGSKYASQQVIPGPEFEWLARDAGLKRCEQLNCDYYLSLDSVARLDSADTLRILIEANKTIVAPLVNRPTKLWSNFWGSMTPDGYYLRSHDYVELVKRDRVGLWNVAHIMNAYLIKGKFIRDNLPTSSSSSSSGIEDISTNHHGAAANHGVRLTYRDNNATRSMKPVLMFTKNLRDANVHLHMINTLEFGHLIDPTNYNITMTHPDFYQLAENVLDWERTYLHDNYSMILEEDDYKLEQPCQDVFWFPLVNENFCRQLIDIMESFGQWSGGTNHDPRIEGGYESVPTRDIHMRQVGLHEMWLLFLRDYIMPVQLKEYIGYEHDPPRANLAFVVRYHPAEQASLQPHHDSSTYTLNIALNSPGQDYEGGGCRFERYNCSVTQSRKGWALMHPGRLTHYHEGLPVTNGTRYIMVTFIDP